ncbi:DUF2110 family protein [Candidatus Bathyarchaeota archaeon]|nr:DUF2110 family protein [Candidatus Bathyarchaeota archaeon]
MPTVTLSTKIHNDSQLKLVSKILKTKLKGLQVEVKISGVTSHGWVQIDVSGDDEKVAMHYLADEVGICPTSLANIKKFLEFRSRLMVLEKNRDQMYADIGISVNTIISLEHLQAQFADGRKLALRKLIELFGFCVNLPLTIKILKVDKEKNCVEAILSEKQLTQYRNWMKSLLDQLIILGSSFYDVRLALQKAGLNRDVLNVEPLGLFEFAVTCKLGTDAAGLIPKIGKNLRSATFTVFSPKRVLGFLGYSALFISE